MVLKNTMRFISFVLLIITLYSCKKTPGYGGNATIKGTYWARNYDMYRTYVTGRYPAINTNIYLFFGDELSPGASVTTNANGEFEFKYLRKGKYKVVAYSKQRQSTPTTPNIFPVETIVNITKRLEVKNIGLDTLDQ